MESGEAERGPAEATIITGAGREQMQISMVNPTTNQVKQRKLGFSWTTLFFGFWVALFRGDWKWTLIQLLIGIFTFGLSSIVFAFIYNKINLNELIEKGYRPADEFSSTALRGKGLIIPTGELNAWTPETPS
jgi:hypothetical protein